MSGTAVRRTIVAALVLTPLIEGLAQSPKPPAFEAASVYLTQPRTPSSQRVTPTRVNLVNQSLWSLLLMAYKLKAYQLSGPDWLRQVRVDVQATIPVAVPPELWPEMLQTLLRDRFDLAAHIESRPVDAYELTVGRDGIKMDEAEALDEVAKEFPDAFPSGDFVSDTLDGPVRTMGVPLGTRTLTARTRYERRFTERRTTVIEAIRMTMPELAGVLAGSLDEPVLDRTGLTGIYRFTIELPPDASAIRALLNAGITKTVQGTPITDPTGVSVFKAVEGLGLRLEKRRSPFDVVVVDRIERKPREN